MPAMTRHRWCLIALSALAPVSVQVHTGGDTVATVVASDGTRFEVLAGTGQYAFISRGCNGSIVSQRPISFQEVGGAVEHGVGGGVSVGARGGWIRDDLADVAESEPFVGISVPRERIENRYVNPYFTYEHPNGSIGLGWVFHQKEFITAGE